VSSENSATLNITCPKCFVTNRVPGNRVIENPACGKCHEHLFNGSPTPVDTEQFNKVVAHSDLPVIVDFWADWCGPCKMFAPIYVQAAEQLEPDYRLLKVDTEANQAISMKYQIRSIPTLAIFKNGVEVARQAGAMPLSSFLDWVKSSG
jgi:thioredoxin 2